MNAIEKTQNAGNADFHHAIDVGHSFIGLVASEIYACAIMKFMVNCVRSVLHRSTQSPTTSGNFVSPKRLKISSCELRRKAKLSKRDERTLFGLRAGCHIQWLVGRGPNRLLEASETTALFNNKADIFGFALIPR